MPENMTVVTGTPVTMTEQNSTHAVMATSNAQTITIIGGDQYPVSSVNGKTGAVVLDADDVGAVAKETGKGLSTNDYTDADKLLVYSALQTHQDISGKADKATTYTKTEVNSALSNKVAKETGKGLSTNDYTDADKEKVDNAVQPDELKYQYTNALTTPATITDSNGGKILNAVITGNSTQDGTPTSTAPIDIENTGDTLKLTSCGEISSIFPIGSEITINRSNNPIVWRVVDYNHFDLASGKTEPMLTLEMKNVYGSGTAYKQFVFDAPEALYYAEEALSAGTYHFTFNYSSSSVVSGTYQFTLTQAVPAGGQIILGTNLNARAITDCKISTYSEIGGTAAIESNIDVTAGSDGTDLGITGSGNLNHPHRILWGSNNYAQSALRQWLNSSADLGSVWTPTNKFDRAPSWNTSADTAYKGFMLGFDSEFLGAVQAAVVPCCTNSVYEVNSTDGSEFAINQVYNLEDKFFLLSRPEMYGTWDSTTYKDGELLDFYDGLTDTERKKFDAFGSVQFAWLRSPYPFHAYYERVVYTDGRLSGTIANNSIGVAAACMISVANMAELINNGKATYSALDNIETYTVPLTDINGTSHIMRQYDVVKKHDDGKWYFEQNTGYIASYNGESVTMIMSSTGELLTGAQVLYRLTETVVYELNTTAQTVLNSIALQKGNISIYFTNAVTPVMTADYPRDLQLYCKSLEARIEALENIQ